MSISKKHAAPHVVVTIPTANFTQRKILEGILAYSSEHGPWLFHLNTGDIATQGIKRIEKWGVDGMIALSANQALLNKLSHINKPIVLINPPPHIDFTAKRLVIVRRDNLNLGKMAAEYLLSRGYRSFAFVGSPRPAEWSDGRRDGFIRKLDEFGFSCNIYSDPTPEERADFSLEAPRLGAWLKSLPKRTALFTVKDYRGQQILAACLDVGISVPDDLAVLSTGDDAVLCEAATPSLSSIALDGENTGRICAKALEVMMNGRKPHKLVDIAFPRIVTRRPTDTFAVNDPILSRVLSIVRAQLGQPIRLAAIAEELGISMRTIETKSMRLLGHPIREEILRLRISEGIAMLTNSPLSISDIATHCGFCNASHFSRCVSKVFGYPPGAFRVKVEKTVEPVRGRRRGI